MREYAFYCAVLIYALFSSPTPDTFGWAEFVIAILLIFGIAPLRSFGFLVQKTMPAPLGFHRLFILWMMSVPLVIGAINGYPPTDIIRDIIPLALLALPLCFTERDLKRLPLILMIAGGCFAARYIFIALPSLLSIGSSAGNDVLLYLANSPLLPFACLFGFGVLTSTTKTYLTHRVIGLIILGITLSAMAVMIQRAPLVLSLIGCSLILAMRFGIAPFKTTLITIGLAILITPIISIVTQVGDGFLTKTLTVGANNRIDEFAAVLSDSTFFGHGWGAIWQSPAVGDYWVRYTHNMSSYYWLKAGVIGGVLSICFILFWLRHSIKIIMGHDFATGIALIVPLIIHMTLYTGYKTFDFALLLTLVFLCNKDHLASLSSTEHSRHNSGQQAA